MVLRNKFRTKNPLKAAFPPTKPAIKATTAINEPPLGRCSIPATLSERIPWLLKCQNEAAKPHNKVRLAAPTKNAWPADFACQNAAKNATKAQIHHGKKK